MRPDGSAVVAFDKLTGKVRWKTGDDLASYASPVVAKIGGRDIVFMFARGGLLAIDPAKGETITSFPWRARILESVNASTPVVRGNEVFISETYQPGSALVRFTGSAFEEIWSDRNRRRDRADGTPLEHADRARGLSIRLERLPFARRPSCDALNGKPATCCGANPIWAAPRCC